ncbi:response regulator transcription factor [Nonomuraea africana]|uniref:response regulator transcription factor n=1 Tax=Nonomuraea africana TaxID=46171 RepID=UPI0033F58D18
MAPPGPPDHRGQGDARASPADLRTAGRRPLGRTGPSGAPRGGSDPRTRQPGSAGQPPRPQPRQIVELAAEGLTNKEIGERLYLSYRTVGSHLYQAFPSSASPPGPSSDKPSSLSAEVAQTARAMQMRAFRRAPAS